MGHFAGTFEILVRESFMVELASSRKRDSPPNRKLVHPQCGASWFALGNATEILSQNPAAYTVIVLRHGFDVNVGS